MATRYLAVISREGGDATSYADELAQRSNLIIVHKTPKTCVLLDAAASYVRISETGVIIGHLFTNGSKPSRVRSLDPSVCAAVAKSELRSLLRSHWGGYVALLDDPFTRRTVVLREPSGAMPCLFLTHGTFTLVTSDMETLLSCGIPAPRIHWDDLARHLWTHGLRSEKTCLDGISELLPGTRLEVGKSTFTARCWSPWDHADPSFIPDYDLAVTDLRDTVLGCLSAWAGCFQHVLLGVSGGLDSSIVAAGVAADTKLTCLTMATDEPFGDERRYARQLTNALDVPLVEAFYDFKEVDLTHSTCAHLPVPAGNPVAQTSNLRKLAIAEANNVDAFFSGAGGDNVFCYILSASPLLDRVKAEGTGGRSWQTLLEICRLTGCSIWDVFAMALRRRFAGGPAYKWRPAPLFLNPDRVSRFQPLQHSWLEAPKGAAVGKAAHIAGILRMQVAPDIFPRTAAATQILPLMSQPIMEFCLKIPTWQWIKDGRNRALARDAFASILPKSIAERTSKGGPGSFAYQLMDRNRPLVRTQLLDGVLAQQGLLDLNALAPILRDERPLQQADRMRLSELVEAEAWARAWSSNS